MPASAWGIDIGNRALKAVKLARTADGLAIADFAFIEHDTILSEAGDNRDALVQTALAKFAGRHDTKRVPVCVGVSGQQSFARFVPLPPVEAKKIPEIVKFEAVQQIPFPLDEVEWSYQTFQRDDDPDVQVGIFAIRKELINEWVGHFMEVDLDVHSVQTSPLAVYNAVRHEGRLDKGHAVLVDIGADSTDLIVADPDSIWMRSLDVGGNAFTEALAKAFKIDFEKAEEMKRNAKSSKYAKQIYQAMRPVFGELAGEIQRSLGFFQSSHREAKLRKIVALGGGFKLNGLSGYLQKNLQMPVEKPQKFNAAAPDDASAAAALSEHFLSSTAAYGLALQEMAEARVTSSLLPTHIRKDKMWREKTKYFVLAGGLVCGAALVAFGSYLFNAAAYERAEGKRQQIAAVYGRAQDLDSQWATVSGGGGDQLKTVQNLNRLVEGRDYWGPLLADIFAAVPGPDARLREAMAGALGEPGVADEADEEALAATPRGERAYVQVQELESVYTDLLHEVADSVEFYTTAIEILNSANPSQISAVETKNVPELIPEAERFFGDEERGRGYVMRLTLTTPMSVEDVYGTFDTGKRLDIPNRLAAIGRDDPDRPYRVLLAALRRVESVKNDPQQLARLEDQHAARQAVASGDVDAQSAADPAGPAAGPAGAGAGGFTPYGNVNPYANNPYAGGGNPYASGAGAVPSSASSADRDNPAYLDPVTGESMLDDSVMQIVFAVEIYPKRGGGADDETGGADEADDATEEPGDPMMAAAE